MAIRWGNWVKLGHFDGAPVSALEIKSKYCRGSLGRPFRGVPSRIVFPTVSNSQHRENFSKVHPRKIVPQRPRHRFRNFKQQDSWGTCRLTQHDPDDPVDMGAVHDRCP